jgi:hypothetical protein
VGDFYCFHCCFHCCCCCSCAVPSWFLPALFEMPVLAWRAGAPPATSACPASLFFLPLPLTAACR